MINIPHFSLIELTNSSDDASREDGRTVLTRTLRWRRWRVDLAEGKSNMPYAVLDRVFPGIAIMIALLVLPPHEHERSKRLITLRGQTGARLYRPRDYSAHVRSRWSFDHTTAVSPKHGEPFHLRMCLQQRPSASATRPTC
ncbi:uncharacterized protein BDR25DRAFT_32412 [Lindgomyces ingoldianus]|uniref:Uncharacterized protein n=1 Tax=Lindgomyces ingoldianus TaxID=673940 RepID=A0ACB6QV90_9PLEO|nr:uncharacterized protein BDR25DRAFT_32412 [Lindgomyces ingoldianus]KAF2470777.1 hypothetical protein BDR25DRAFT_32412 [Lindgomyces ingoldianus]